MAEQGVLAQVRRWAYYLASRPPHWTWQCFNWLITRNVTNKRFFKRDDLAWSANVEAKYPEVRKEVEKLLEHVKSMPTVHDMIPTTGYYFSERDWRQVTFFSYGTRIEDNCELYPNIWEAFSRVPDLVSGTVSILAPNEIVPAHEHSYKGLLIFHMGVVIPESGGGCGIRVDTEESRWQEGEVFAIDPTYDHEVWNRTDQYRAILLGEFRRPDLPGPLKFLDRIFIWAFGASLGKRLAQEASAVAAKHREVIEGGLRPAAG